MICTSVARLSAQDCIESIASLDMAEIRLDSMHLSEDEVAEIFSSHQNLVATCRPGEELSLPQRTRLLQVAIDSGAAWVDLELDMTQSAMSHMVALAHANDCKVIVSYHDFYATAGREELLRIRAACLDAGADIAKIACMVNDPIDSARLLGLLEMGPALVVGMGPLGVITRLAAPLLGAPFTYASMARGEQTAPGQVDMATLQKWILAIEKQARER